MKIIATSILLLFFYAGRAQVLFSDYFTGERLRYDYVIAGDYHKIYIYDNRFVREPEWGGSTVNLIDTFRYGELFVEVFDSASGEMIYSRGYSSLFKEWQIVNEAKYREKAFLESIIVPFPVNTIKLIINERDSLSEFVPVHFTYLNPHYPIVSEGNHRIHTRVHNLMSSGPSSNMIDIAIIAEGYTSTEETDFLNAANDYMEYFFTWEPYKNYRNKFNFYAVFVPSEQSGTDIPNVTIWRNTVLNTSFNTFGSERYLTTSDLAELREIVMDIPYDQICVMVNTEKYGGGGVYNSFTVFSAKNEFSGFLFLHEFGHAFAGLADEYYTSPTAYDEMIGTNIEPYQPNITTHMNFHLKWEDMINDTVPVPTPNCEKYSGVVGLFEGAAYQAKGIYRPAYDCAMKSKTFTEFCPVCQRAIERMIWFCCGE